MAEQSETVYDGRRDIKSISFLFITKARNISKQHEWCVKMVQKFLYFENNETEVDALQV